MIKMIATVCRRPGMTHAEFVAYIQQVHGAISRENPVTLRRYVQNHVFDAAFGTAAEPAHCMPVSRDSVTELYWDSPQAMQATLAHEHVRTKVGPDGARFADVSTTYSLVAIEAEQAVQQPGPGGAKVLHFLRAAPGLSLADFFERWAQAHAHVLETEPRAAQSVRRCIHNRQVPEANAALAYFSAKDVPIYEGVAALWFDDVSCIGAFRHYEKALLAHNEAGAHSRFFVPAQSFFVYATEVPILERV